MKQITDTTFDGAVLDVEHTVVVKFTASWCAPCRAFNPILLEAEKDHPHISFYEVDVEENEGLTEDFEVRSLPTMLIFHEGQQVGEAKGLVSKNVLYAVLSKFGE